jgi:hypothetical protein
MPIRGFSNLHGQKLYTDTGAREISSSKQMPESQPRYIWAGSGNGSIGGRGLGVGDGGGRHGRVHPTSAPAKNPAAS